MTATWTDPETPPADPQKSLRSLLVSQGLVTARGQWSRLAGGRTNRLWQVSGPDGNLVVKLFAPACDNPLFDNDPVAEERLLLHLTGSGLAPHLVASLATPFGHCLIYHHIAGDRWSNHPGAVAQILRDLHNHAPLPDLRQTPDGSEQLTNQTLAILSLCNSGEAADLRKLTPAGTVTPSNRRQLLHGDCVPGNLIEHHGQITLIDWQCPVIGDPVTDLAIFLSPAMQHIYRGAPLTAAETAAFLKAYDAPPTLDRLHALSPWFHWRMAAYCLWRDEQGAKDYRAAMHLELAALVC